MNASQIIDYDLLNKQMIALLGGEPDALANSANFAALLFDQLPTINWCGIYVARADYLVLGPFQGRPACVRIPMGQGVCGTAAAEGRTLRVSNVQEFDGHIACDPASQSELVVPLLLDGRLVGVLDIDSPVTDRFSAADQDGVELLCGSFLNDLARQGNAFI